MKKEQTYNALIEISKRIARAKKGALFLVGPAADLKRNRDELYPAKVSLDLSERAAWPVLERLATLDGATLVTPNGRLAAFGAKLRRTRVFSGFGTRHAAAHGITAHLPKTTAILVSEESGRIKVFRQGRIMIEMDAAAIPKNITQKVVSFLSDGDTALFTAAGASAAILGSAALPPVLIAGGAYLAIKTASGMIKRHFE